MSVTPRPLGTVDVSTSGGRTELIAHPGQAAPASPVPLGRLWPYGTLNACVGTVHEAGNAPFLAPGQVVAWHYGESTETARVISDDERGLIAWVPNGAPRLSWVPVGVEHFRDLSLQERFTAPRAPRHGRWNGPGILRVAPAGKPWSLWWFYDQTGACQGIYVNLELPHRREGIQGTHTRDLVLDLWLDAEGVWLKDADELDACVGNRFTPEQADDIRALGAWAAWEVTRPDAGWPMDAGFETFRPTPAQAAPIDALPDVPLVRRALAALAE